MHKNFQQFAEFDSVFVDLEEFILISTFYNKIKLQGKHALLFCSSTNYLVLLFTTLQKNSWIITEKITPRNFNSSLLKTKMISLLIQNAFPVSSGMEEINVGHDST